MTLDEAIKHAEEVAEAKEREAKINRNHGGWAYDNEATKCSACAEEHQQLAEWLKGFLYRIEGKEGVYCKNCVDEIKIQNAIDSRK